MRSAIQVAFLARIEEAKQRTTGAGKPFVGLTARFLNAEEGGEPLRVASFHKSDLDLPARLSPRHLVHIAGTLKLDGLTITGCTADEITPLSEPDAMPKARKKEPASPLSARPAGKRAGPPGKNEMTQSQKMGAESSLSGRGTGSATPASPSEEGTGLYTMLNALRTGMKDEFAPKNEPKLSAAELFKRSFGAEITGEKSKYGDGFDPRAGDSLEGLF